MTALAEAFVEIVPDFGSFGRKLEDGVKGASTRARPDTKSLAESFDKAGAESGKRFGGGVGRSLSGLGAGLLGGLAGGLVAQGVGALAGAFGNVISGARESARVSKISESVIKSTGGAAGLTADQIGDLATAISNKTGIDDEAIQANENLLLTFTNVRNEVGKGNDVFSQATGLAQDMATVLGGDSKNSAMQLGKALNDPVKGLTALSRSGVSFTEQQRKQVTAMVKSGNVLGAQKIILGEVGKEFGGAATAAADPTQKLMTTVGNLGEKVGGFLLPVIDTVAVLLMDKVIPTVESGVEWLGGMASTVAGNLEPAMAALSPVIDSVGSGVVTLVGFLAGHQEIFIGIGAAIAAVLVPAFIAWAASAGAAAVATIAAAAPFIAIGVVIAGLAMLIRHLWENNETFRKVVLVVWGAIKTAIAAVVSWFQGTVWPILQKVIGFIIGYYKLLFTVVKTVFTGIWNAISLVVSWFMETAWPIIKRAVDFIIGYYRFLFTTGKAIWDRVFEVVKAVIDKIVGVLKGVGSRVSGMWDGIKESFRAVINWVIDAWNGLSLSMPSVDVAGRTIGGWTLDTPNIPHLADGGIVRARRGGTAIVAGEGGSDEAVVPLDGRHGFGPTVNIHPGAVVVDARGATDPGAVGDAVSDALERVLRLAGAGTPRPGTAGA